MNITPVLPQKAPPRFGTISNVSITNPNPNIMAKTAKAFAQGMQEAYKEVSLKGSAHTLANRLLPFTLLLNAPDAATIQTKKGEVVMFTGSDSKLLAAATLFFEKVLAPYWFFPHEILQLYKPELHEPMKTNIAIMLNTLLSSSLGTDTPLEIFEYPAKK